MISIDLHGLLVLSTTFSPFIPSSSIYVLSLPPSLPPSLETITIHFYLLVLLGSCKALSVRC